MACTLLCLLIANSTFGPTYSEFWQTPLAGMSLEHWVNDALMAIFFLLIGLELERELYVGEDAFQFDTQVMLKSVWLYACTAAHVKHPGDYFVFEVGHNAIIIVRVHDRVAANRADLDALAVNIGETIVAGFRKHRQVRAGITLVASRCASAARCAPTSPAPPC